MGVPRVFDSALSRHDLREKGRGRIVTVDAVRC